MDILRKCFLFRNFSAANLEKIMAISRIVTLPDFQGIGLAGQFLDVIAGGLKDNGYSLYITTSHPAMIRALNHRNTWTINRQPSRVAKQGKTSSNVGKMDSSRSRLTTSYK